MLQVAQPVSGGGPRLRDVPPPALRAGGVIVRAAWSLVSPGTERAIVALAGKSLVGKARSRPEQMRAVLSKVRAEGLSAALNAVRARLSADLPLGYSAAGWVEEVGEGVADLHPGQLVACAGMGYASHAERIFVPRNLVARVPSGVDARHAATVTLGAIALQGVRRADVRLGERVGVIGLGVLGLLTVQMLRAAGCHVFAVDIDPRRVALAHLLGAEVALTRDDGSPAERARAFTAGQGLDAAVVTAASESSDPATLAAECCRLGGRVVIVGATGLDVPRNVLYDRELDVRLARSYGPGRYDPQYEERGIDYPYAWVRFTEGRNMEEYLSLLARGEVDVEPLLTHEFGIEEAENAYRFLLSEEGAAAVGLLFRYGATEPARVAAATAPRRASGPRSGVGVAVIGAGSFARSVLLPALAARPDVRMTGVVTATGLSAAATARSFSFRYASTEVEEVLDDGDTDAVVIATRHAGHARVATAALRAGKDVFLEKPMAMAPGELASLCEAARATGRILMVGFNRRFAPAAAAVREMVRDRSSPLQALYRIDAGPLPAEHWTRDPTEGGGRILGEACHFVDFLLYLVGQPVERVQAEVLPGDGVSGTLRFADGSVGSLVYAVSGHPAGGKERIEIFAEGVTAVLDNWRRLVVGAGGRLRRRRVAAGKGHREEIAAFIRAVKEGGPSPVPVGQAAWSTRATIALLESAARGAPVTLREEA